MHLVAYSSLCNPLKCGYMIKSSFCAKKIIIFYKEIIKWTFFLVRPRKRQRPTRCWTADILWFLPFRRIAPAVAMIGFNLDDCLLWTEFEALLRNFYRVGATACHSLRSLAHLKAFRSFSEVERKTDFFLLTSFLHSFSNFRQVWLTNDFCNFLALKAALLIAV